MPMPYQKVALIGLAGLAATACGARPEPGTATPARSCAFAPNPSRQLAYAQKGDIIINGDNKFWITQMTVPSNAVGIFHWRAKKKKLIAEGHIRVVGPDANDSGGLKGTEYWYIDKIPKGGIDLAETLIVEALCISDEYPADFIPPILPDGVQPVTPTPETLNQKPRSNYIAFTYTDEFANNNAGMAAVAFVVTSGGLVHMLWLWRPNDLPGLFGTEATEGDLLVLNKIWSGDDDFPTYAAPPYALWKFARPPSGPTAAILDSAAP
jgi:hypothetical protein